MNKKLIDWWAGSVAIDSDYQAVLDRATALGYTKPTAAEQTKQNLLVIALKAAGIWTLLDILYIFANNGSKEFATLNWKAPTLYRCTLNSSPTFTSDRGFTGDGAAAWIDTGWTPSTNGVNYTLNEAGIVTHYFTDGTSADAGYAAGESNAAADAIALITYVTAVTVGRYVINGALGSPQAASKRLQNFTHIQRTASNVTKHFENGVQQGSNGSIASTALPNATLGILARNNQNISRANFRNDGLTMFAAGASLTGKESAFYNAYNAYYSTL